MKLWVWLLLIVAFLAFCVFCYDRHTDRKADELKIRTNKKMEGLETQAKEKTEAVAILSYALSITPEGVKNEVFFDRIKENFPHVENHTELLHLIKSEKTEAEAEKTDVMNKKDKTQVAQDV